MARPKGDNPISSEPTSAPVNQGQPASVPNRAKMATYDTGEAPPVPEIDFAARLGNVVPTSNPLTGEATTSGTEEIPTPQAAPAPQPEGQPAPVELPDKYRNKTPEELVRMHQEAEKAMHSRDEEIRIAREYQNRFMQGQLTAQPIAQPAPVQPTVLPQDDVKMLELMLSKPTEFKKAMVADLMQTIGQSAQQAEVTRTFESNRAVISTPEFGKFLQTVPPSICQAADKDPQVLSYLLNSFKQATPAPSNPVAQAEAARTVAAKTNSARTTVGGSAGANQPTFTRLQLMEMQMKDPDRYAALQPEIMRLYAQNLL